MASHKEILKSPIIPITMGALWLVLLISNHGLSGQESASPAVGLRDNTPRVHALVGAIVVTAPGKVIENGVIILRDGMIEAVGADLTLPGEARVWDLAGKTIYPGFIDSYTQLGLPKNLRPLKKKPKEKVFGEGPHIHHQSVTAQGIELPGSERWRRRNFSASYWPGLVYGPHTREVARNRREGSREPLDEHFFILHSR